MVADIEGAFIRYQAVLTCFVFVNPSNPPPSPTRNVYYQQFTNEKTMVQTGCSGSHRVIRLIQKPMLIRHHPRRKERKSQGCHSVSKYHPQPYCGTDLPYMIGNLPLPSQDLNQGAVCFSIVFRILWTS